MMRKYFSSSFIILMYLAENEQQRYSASAIRLGTGLSLQTVYDKLEDLQELNFIKYIMFKGTKVYTTTADGQEIGNDLSYIRGEIIGIIRNKDL